MRIAKDRAFKFWCYQADWSREAFGSDTERGPAGPLKHLAKEVGEALEDLEDPIKLKLELVDCLFLVFDSARRAGLSYDDLMDKAFEKLEINKAREWVRQEGDLTEPIEHIR